MPRRWNQALLFGQSASDIGLPLATCAILLAAGPLAATGAGLTLVGLGLVVAVVMAVHHAEVIAHRVGEPFGTLVLALAVTAIEAALIVSILMSGGAGASAVARDTVYAAVMIVCNGVLGLCLLAGAQRHRVLRFQVDGAIPTLSVLVALAMLTLVLPNYTLTTPGPTFSPAQLAFAGVVSLVLYASFVFVQTVRHRDYFLPVTPTGDLAGDGHAPPPSAGAAGASLVLLLLCLTAVVGLAKALSPAIRSGVAAAGAPPAVVGVAIAMLVLAPETLAAVRAARHNRMQTSLNLALGSALATIGLTIPVVAAVSMALDLPLELGLLPKDTVLLVLTLFVAALSLGSGRATIQQGCVHLALFAVFLFMAVVP
ncbi:MAG: hypothetical protein RLZZ126_449 [Pseudomonadota bacterium]|jgi:Ca2+:H+ antiporter